MDECLLTFISLGVSCSSIMTHYLVSFLVLSIKSTHTHTHTHTYIVCTQIHVHIHIYIVVKNPAANAGDIKDTV